MTKTTIRNKLHMTKITINVDFFLKCRYRSDYKRFVDPWCRFESTVLIGKNGGIYKGKCKNTLVFQNTLVSKNKGNPL